jgi:hypothetical protein
VGGLTSEDRPLFFFMNILYCAECETPAMEGVCRNQNCVNFCIILSMQDTYLSTHAVELEIRSKRLMEEMKTREWTQAELRAYVREMGVEISDDEVIPQGMKYIAWPPPPITEEDIESAKKLIEEFPELKR